MPPPAGGQPLGGAGIVTLVRWHDRDIPRTDRAIARAVGKLGRTCFAAGGAGAGTTPPKALTDRHRLADIQQAEDILDGLLARQQCFSLRDLAVKGGDMAALGLRGREIGDMLRALLDAVLDGAPNEKNIASALARDNERTPEGDAFQLSLSKNHSVIPRSEATWESVIF